MINNESGRSMVEMLGVLAIMGIITLGGLAGYRTAMNKFRANAIAELIAEASVEGQTRNKCVSFNDLSDWEKLPQCVSSVKGAENGQVEVVFSEESGCEDIRKAVATSFGKCKLDVGDNYIIFIPNRGQKCTIDSCSDECEEYTKSGCLN